MRQLRQPGAGKYVHRFALRRDFTPVCHVLNCQTRGQGFTGKANGGLPIIFTKKRSSFAISAFLRFKWLAHGRVRQSNPAQFDGRQMKRSP